MSKQLKQIKKIENVDFWARELRLPLFWISAKNHKAFANETIIFYKKNQIHVYHFGTKEKKAAESGFNYFSKKENVCGYIKKVEKVIKKLLEIKEYFNKINVRNLDNERLELEFKKVIKILNNYSNVYTLTENFYLRKFENLEKKYKTTLKELGEWRYKLRESGQPVFYLLLGVLIKEIAKRNNEKVSDIFLYSEEDLKKLFKGKKLKQEIIFNRRKGCVYISFSKKYEIIHGDLYKKLYKKIALGSRRGLTIIKGRVANGGVVSGVVRIIAHTKRNIAEEVKKFKNGEILVTEMTQPDTILACKKAKAIITDEGGVTSHAAIISRELNIPCIIGTKIATQVLKDGDEVEVDADNGVVKKLNC